jgi:hypothetical protein
MVGARVKPADDELLARLAMADELRASLSLFLSFLSS